MVKKKKTNGKKKIAARIGTEDEKLNEKEQGAKAPISDEGKIDQIDLYEARLKKLQHLIEIGKNPYEQSFVKTESIQTLLSTPENNYKAEKVCVIAGRIRSRRMMGKAGFLDIEDETGRIQIYGSKELPGNDFDIFRTTDLGDIVGIEGILFKTKMGQTSLRIKKFTVLSKCLRPLPVVKEADGKRFDEVVDKELRYRMRYVDLIVNPDVRETFKIRSQIISYIRTYLTNAGFLEVETPMMHPIPGGATARPFITHHNALGIDLYLRVAPELYLKRLLVGGFSRVFEINRNFRNEGISYKHNPEFTMLELYQSYSDMEEMLNLCQELIESAAESILGQTVLTYGSYKINLKKPWNRMTYIEAIQKFSGVNFIETMTLTEAIDEARNVGIDTDELKQSTSIWQIAEMIFDEKVESNLIQPTFITEFPREISPLARTQKDNKNFVDRFEPYIAGAEIGNAFSELNDPIDQKKRFEKQVKERESGTGEGGYMDSDYIRALEYGMPPAGGMGIGIDRLTMLFTNSRSIRDTILFPLMRPETDSGQA